MAERRGQVGSVSESGDLITDIKVTDLEDAPRDESLRVQCDGHTTLGLFSQDHGQPEMTLLAFENQHGYVQISIVGGDASGFLGIKPGAEVVVSW